MSLQDQIIEYLRGHPGSRACELARALSADSTDIGRILYSLKDRQFIVTRYNQTHGTPMPRVQTFATEREAQDCAYTMRNARIPPTVERLPAITVDMLIGSGQSMQPAILVNGPAASPLPGGIIPDDMREARSAIARLKRGVPPCQGICRLAVGMKRLEQRLQSLLLPDTSPRWFGLTGEYGEGKSFFRALACEHALKAGYAVAFFDVNRDEGALHQPQRHLTILLESLQSPLPHLQHHQGIVDLLRHWIMVTPSQVVLDTLARLGTVLPSLKGVADHESLRLIVANAWNDRANGISESSPYLQRLLLLLSASDLVGRSSYARFSAAYRMQLVVEWLSATGHKGLLLFIDEIDNVIRQIHPRAHPACFRTLAWYCSSTSLTPVRVIFAMTPEMSQILDYRGRSAFGKSLDDQQSVIREECQVFDRWNHEARILDAKGWEVCSPIRPAQRVDLFHRISAIHRTAWGASRNLTDEQLHALAKSASLDTTRRWVRASIQILELLTQHSKVAL